MGGTWCFICGRRAGLALGAVALLVAASGPAAPESATASIPADAGEIERFCSNIADKARDRRYTIQSEELAALQQEVDKRLKLLEEKRAEYESWMQRREEFIAKATDNVVKIYSGMRPDAAAERLAELEPMLAAGIMIKIDARKAGVILNEMDRKAAAELTSIMAASARRTDPS